MSAIHTTLTAKTKTELRKLAREWLASARGGGFGYVEADYRPDRVKKTEDGYSITVAASD